MTDIIPLLLGVVILFAIVAWVGKIVLGWVRPTGSVTASGPLICAACGSRGTPKTQTKGSIWLEIALWICFLVPGLIYSIWRLTTRQQVCAECGTPGMISVNSPRGRHLAAQFKPL
jgi:hypothetical protein